MDEKEFVCKECNRICKSKIGLSSHIVQKHNKKEYYDKWIRKEDEGLCKICGKESIFLTISRGYKNCCCKEHRLKYIDICAKAALTKKYGGNTPFCKKETHEKSKQTLIKKYGVDHNFKLEKVKKERKNTWIKNYGVDNPSKSEKIKKQKEETCLKHHGVKAGFANEEKRKNTWIKNYSVDNPSKDKEIFEKQQRNSFYSRKYRNTNINYRGDYELDFLNEYYNKYSDIQNGPTIKYKFKRKNRTYFPDFYIPSLNLIIEIKNSYLAKKDKEIIHSKKQGTKNKNYNYIMIVNKDYTKFNKLINEC